MDLRDRQALKTAAREDISGAAYNPTQLIVIHTLIALGASLIVTALNHLLETRIADTGGLGGLGLRSILSTVQSVLSLGMTLVLPFWNLGYVSASLKLSRRQTADPRCLTDGFRRFGPALRLLFLEGLLYVCLAVAAMQLALPIFAMTPLSDRMSALILELAESNPDLLTGSADLLLNPETESAFLQSMIPLLILYGAVCLVLVIPVSYRLRMSRLCIMDEPRTGALAAMKRSNHMMRGNALDLFKLDLSFWWVYLCQLLIGLVAYLDMLLPLLGIQLPFSETTAYFVFYVLSLVAQLALYAAVMNQVQVTYAGAYDLLRQNLPQPSAPAQAPEQNPWT